jgi:hypothetical protein
VAGRSGSGSGGVKRRRDAAASAACGACAVPGCSRQRPTAGSAGPAQACTLVGGGGVIGNVKHVALLLGAVLHLVQVVLGAYVGLGKRGGSRNQRAHGALEASRGVPGGRAGPAATEAQPRRARPQNRPSCNLCLCPGPANNSSRPPRLALVGVQHHDRLALQHAHDVAPRASAVRLEQGPHAHRDRQRRLLRWLQRHLRRRARRGAVVASGASGAGQRHRSGARRAARRAAASAAAAAAWCQAPPGAPNRPSPALC